MQTDITVHDTDQKQGNVMNNNINRCGSRKEKKMNGTTKTTTVAVLVTLGLTLSGNAAEGWPRWHGPLGTGQAPDSPALIAEAPAG